MIVRYFCWGDTLESGDYAITREVAVAEKSNESTWVECCG